MNLPVMYYVSHSLITFRASPERCGKDGYLRIHIIIDARLFFAGVTAVQTAYVLGFHSSNQNCTRVNVRLYPLF